jgi:hypothetical protein
MMMVKAKMSKKKTCLLPCNHVILILLACRSQRKPTGLCGNAQRLWAQLILPHMTCWRTFITSRRACKNWQEEADRILKEGDPQMFHKWLCTEADVPQGKRLLAGSWPTIPSSKVAPFKCCFCGTLGVYSACPRCEKILWDRDCHCDDPRCTPNADGYHECEEEDPDWQCCTCWAQRCSDTSRCPNPFCYWVETLATMYEWCRCATQQAGHALCLAAFEKRRGHFPSILIKALKQRYPKCKFGGGERWNPPQQMNDDVIRIE